MDKVTNLPELRLKPHASHLPGLIQEPGIRESGPQQQIRIKPDPRFAIISIDGRDYYFCRPTGMGLGYS
jgi:hypothetical protein